MNDNSKFFIANNRYVRHHGFYGKIYPLNGKWYGEVLNTDKDLMFVDDSLEAAEKTFREGIDQYIEQYSGSPVIYDTMSIRDLISQLIMCASNANTPVYLENGAIITGVYRQNNFLVLDTENKRTKYIQKSLED